MLNIPAIIETLFKTDGTRKNFRVKFPNREFYDITNEKVVKESLHYTESLCSQNNFRFGLAEASVLEFETVGVGNMLGMKIEASIEIDVSSLTPAQIGQLRDWTGDGEFVELAYATPLDYAVFRVPLGVFRVTSCPRDHKSMTHRKVTAYSEDMFPADPNGNIPGMPTELPVFSSYEADFAGILAASNGQGLTKVGNLSFSSSISGLSGVFYNSSGTRYDADLFGGESILTPVSASATLAAPTATSHIDFLKVGSYDADRYYSLGEYIASELDIEGFDFTYNSSKKKIYGTNRDALLAVMPWLFYPTLTINCGTSGDPWKTLRKPIARLMPGGQYGVIWGGTPNAENALFHFKDQSPAPTTYEVWCVNLSTAIDINFSFTVHGAATYTDIVVPPLYDGGPPAVEAYQGEAAGLSIKVSSSGTTGTRSWVCQNQNTDAVSSRTLRLYSYVNVVDYPKLVNGCLELRGEFIKMDRDGGYSVISLPAGTEGMDPADYSEMWWDEYDVAPIGNVVVTVKESDKTNTKATPTIIQIGSGASVYDMSDNEAISMLTDSTLAGITTLLSGDFARNAYYIDFTPVDLTMPGWPWIEAGDILLVDTEDTSLQTYALMVELSGIQNLTAHITSEGGQIVGEV